MPATLQVVPGSVVPSKTFKVADGTKMVAVSISLGGKETENKPINDTTQGDAREVVSEKTERYANVTAYELAKTLEGRARAAIKRYAHKLGSLRSFGYVTSGASFPALLTDVAAIQSDAAAHNAQFPESPVRVLFQQMNLAPAIDADTARKLCNEVTDALMNARGILICIGEGIQFRNFPVGVNACDAAIEAGQAWLIENRNLHTLLPDLAGQVVQDAVECVRTALSAFRKARRSDGKTSISSVWKSVTLDPLDSACGWTSHTSEAE